MSDDDVVGSCESLRLSVDEIIFLNFFRSVRNVRVSCFSRLRY